jgi:hypothetical protein
MDSASAYVLHFDKGAIPPANAFRSITLYDAEGYQAVNSLNRFAIGNCMPVKNDSDVSLDLLLPECQSRRRQRGELAAGSEGGNHPHDAFLCTEERCPNREVEPALGDEARPNNTAADAIGLVAHTPRFTLWETILGNRDEGAATPTCHARA